MQLWAEVGNVSVTPWLSLRLHWRLCCFSVRLCSSAAFTDTQGALPVTVIDETMAKRYLKGQDPIGKRILIQQIIPAKRELGPEVPGEWWEWWLTKRWTASTIRARGLGLVQAESHPGHGSKRGQEGG